MRAGDGMKKGSRHSPALRQQISRSQRIRLSLARATSGPPLIYSAASDVEDAAYRLKTAGFKRHADRLKKIVRELRRIAEEA